MASPSLRSAMTGSDMALTSMRSLRLVLLKEKLQEAKQQLAESKAALENAQNKFEAATTDKDKDYWFEMTKALLAKDSLLAQQQKDLLDSLVGFEGQISPPRSPALQTVGSVSPALSARSSSQRQFNFQELKDRSPRVLVKPRVSFLRQWGSKGTGAGEFQYPNSVVLQDGLAFVADSDNHRISVYTKDGHLLHHWGSYGSGPGQLDCPTSIATTKDRLFVTEFTNHRVSVFSLPEGRFLSSFSSTATSPSGTERLQRPRGIVTDGDLIYIADSENHRICTFRADDGEFIQEFGGEGTEDGQLLCPTGMTLTNEYLFVVEFGNNRVSVFNRIGAFIRHFGTKGSSPGQLYCPRGVAILNMGLVAISEFGNDRISLFQTDGTFVCCFGEKGRGDMQFDSPSAVFANQNDLFIADRGNNRIVVCQIT